MITSKGQEGFDNPAKADGSPGSPGGPDSGLRSNPKDTGNGDPEGTIDYAKNNEGDTGGAETFDGVAQDDDIESKIRELLMGKLDDADLEMLLKLIQSDSDTDLMQYDPDAPDMAAPMKKPDMFDKKDGTPPDDKMSEDEDMSEMGMDEDDNMLMDEMPTMPMAKAPEAKDKMGKDKKMGKDADTMESSPNIMAPKRDPNMTKKPAMDAAAMINEAVRRTTLRLNAVRAAEKAVRPWVGEIQVAMDHAADVYKFALEKSGVDTKGIHPSAYPAMLALCSKPGDVNTRPIVARVAMDANRSKSLIERFPNAARARVLG
jgi:hypothetical protein